MLLGCAMGSAMYRKYSMSLRAWHVSGCYQDSECSVSLPNLAIFRIIEDDKAN